MEVRIYPEPDEVIQSALAKRYDSVPDGPDSFKTLAQRVRVESQKFNRPIINYVPTQFVVNEHDMGPGLPQYQYPELGYIAKTWDFFGSTGGVLITVPIVWQLNYRFHQIARESGLYVASGDIRNTPLSIEILRQTKLRCVVTDTVGALALKAGLEKSVVPHSLNLIIIMRDVREEVSDQAVYAIPGVTILWELQIIPGHTIAYQSLSLAGEPALYHLSKEYQWKLEETHTSITGMDASVLPWWQYHLPIMCHKESSSAIETVFSVTYV